MSACSCDKCQRARLVDTEFPFNTYLALCPECGNKRCPRAADHDNTCTHSNAPGQKGSLYE